MPHTILLRLRNDQNKNINHTQTQKKGVHPGGPGPMFNDGPQGQHPPPAPPPSRRPCSWIMIFLSSIGTSRVNPRQCQSQVTSIRHLHKTYHLILFTVSMGLFKKKKLQYLLSVCMQQKRLHAWAKSLARSRGSQALLTCM